MFNVVVLSTEMEGDADERAEGEVAAVTLHQLRQQKFLTRMASMILKALLIAAAVALLPSLLGQFSALLNFCRRALLTRAWDIVYLILVGVAVSYGVLARGRPGLGEPEGRDSDGGDSYVAKLFDFGGTFADYGDGDRPAHAGDAEPSDPAGGEEPNPIDGRSSPSDEVDLVGKRYARALDGPVSGSNPGPGIGKLEANFGSPVASEKDWSAEKAKRCHSAPPAPAVPVEGRDSNPGPRPQRAERKPPILPPPPPPRPPPPLAPAPRASRGENAAQIATGTESFERKEKGKSEKSEKMVPPPPPPPPPPSPLVPPPPAVLEGGLNPKHESKHRRSKSKEDSKHRSKDESKHRSAGKEIANALGLFSQSERKQAKIPAPPAPPPLPSALQQWFSSYRRESKHRSKDSEPSPRPRSERASRKVHSSSSPPSPPPLPPPPRLPPVYTVDGANASKFSSKPARDGASASKNSTRPRRDETSGSKDSSKPGRDEASRSKDSSGARDRASGGKESSAKPRMDEKPKAAGDGASAIRDLSKPGKEDMAGSVPELKAVEKSARRKSTSIPLPPPPPPHFAMEEEHWSMYDLPKHRKMSSSPVVLWEESAASEPESEHDPEPAIIRRQVSLDGTESQFCPSPSPDEVNRKAEAFIARFHEQIRLQKMNSIRERLDRGSR